MRLLSLLLLMVLIGARAQDVPAPVIHTREEYNNIPTGGKYWYNNRLETKTETTSLSPPKAELVSTPTPAPTVYKYAPGLNSTPAPTPAPIVEPTATPSLEYSPQTAQNTHQILGVLALLAIFIAIIVGARR